MTMQTGDTVTIKRGKLAGQQGEVLMATTETVVLKMKDGEPITQKVSNIKVPTEATITQDELAAILGSVVNSSPEGAVGTFEAIVHALDSKYPGFARRVNGDQPNPEMSANEA